MSSQSLYITVGNTLCVVSDIDNVTVHLQVTMRETQEMGAVWIRSMLILVVLGGSEGNIFTLSSSLLVLYFTCNDISVIYVTAQMCRRSQEEVVNFASILSFEES